MLPWLSDHHHNPETVLRPAIIALALLAGILTTPTAPTPDQGVLRILVVGDSISCGGMYPNPGWCPELSRLLTDNGVTHQLIPAAVGGTRCDYWAEHIGQALEQHHPNLVILGCGTNHGLQPDGQAEIVRQSLLSIAAQVRATGARLLTGIPSYSGDYSGNPDLPARERAAYQGIPAAFAEFKHGVFSPAMFDDTGLPVQFLSADNVHPNAAGYVQLARNRYQALCFFMPLRPFEQDGTL